MWEQKYWQLLSPFWQRTKELAKHSLKHAEINNLSAGEAFIKVHGKEVVVDAPAQGCVCVFVLKDRPLTEDKSLRKFCRGNRSFLGGQITTFWQPTRRDGYEQRRRQVKECGCGMWRRWV